MNKTFKLVFLITTLLVLVSCSNDTEKIKNPPISVIDSPEVYQYGEQEFKIYTYYQPFLDFLEQTEAQPENTEEIYRETVLSSFKDNGFSYSDFNVDIFYTPNDLKELRKTIETLIDKQVELNTFIKEALATSVDKLPGGDKKIHIMPVTPEIFQYGEDMGNTAGYAWNKNSVVLLVGPSFQKGDLQYTVAHEYHHVVNMDIAGSSWYTLLEQSVLEGKADTFATMLYPKVNTPWTKPFTDQENKKVMEIFSANLDSTNTDLTGDFLNGNQWKGIPVWSRYKIGFQIMEEFRTNNPNITVEEWTKIPAKELLEKSKILIAEIE
ncbi:Uncharacterized protein YjaZ [Psychrobacillus sp. OK028]|uniref:DUF2268 domain-containing protein n=1 Tax=Psychrobacillus sp. OK028 TaxID=1884359 RepID=UPI00088A13F9|nr:DUF2268 domain-containing putative Zn-dependent protease [Psychrobacillus sp. OK028]SDO12089.1 Uncharacterized protein YjaZ [Psychrobacillus sp. OK028]